MPLILNFETGGDSDEPIGDDGGVEYDLAQSFTVGASDSPVNRVALYLKKHNTITDAITVRIETNGADVPSGTLVDAGATTTITPTSTSYEWITASFPVTFSLTAATKYWIKCTIGNQASNEKYSWQRDVSNGYAGGGGSVSTDGGAFASEDAANDYYFRIYSPEADGVNRSYSFVI